ncbi:hypothetical protein RUM44_008100 [Polyplax serrata]|uniref:Lipase n=1 Tax=Polyplax serrata TaxID=468196 RepID=A0ABR1BC83_POLSC
MKPFEIFVSAIALSIALFHSTMGYSSPDSYSIAEDGLLKLPELVKKYGYPVETHNVSTQDGYQLTIYRIPAGKNCGNMTLKKPVLIQHGLLSSAYDFLILGPKKSLGYILADNCYDVWLGNNRGNSESRTHVNMTTADKEFWQFTWHEMGKYDIPAIVDHILSTTNRSSLHYVGHSQGTTQFFVFASLYPEYHEKIETMQALSPVVYMKNLKSPIIKFLAPFHQMTEAFMNLVGFNEFQPQSDFLNFLGRAMCKDQFPGLQEMCANVIFLLCGYDRPQLNVTVLPAILGHVPAGASTKQLIHYAQSIVTGKFRQYDFGLFKNLQVYGSISPPDYDLTKINVPIALYYGQNDWLAAIEDIRTLQEQLPNVIEVYQVPYTKFNHLDFTFAIDGKFLLYDRVLQVLKRYH